MSANEVDPFVLPEMQAHLSFVPRDVLKDVVFQEPEQQHLLDQTIDVRRGELQNGNSVYELRTQQLPLTSGQFLGLLNATAPGLDQSPYGIRADWEILDRPDIYEKLISAHADTLGQHWNDFARDQVELSAAFGEMQLEPYVYTFPEYDEATLFISEEAAYDMTNSRAKSALDYAIRVAYEGNLHQLAKLVNPVQLRDALLKYVLADGRYSYQQQRKLMKARNYGAVAKRAGGIKPAHISRYLTEYPLKEVPQHVFAKMLSEVPYVLVTNNNGQTTKRYTSLYPAARGEISLVRLRGEYVKHQGVPHTADVTCVCSSRANTLSRDTTFYHPDSAIAIPPKPAPPEIGITGVLRWFVDVQTGRRTLITNVAKAEKKQVTLPKGVRSYTISDNPTLGLLTLAYLSPQIRERWPTTVRLPGLDRAQDMGAAQVPILALMSRHQLLKSPIIDAAMTKG